MGSDDRNPGFHNSGFTVSPTPDSGCNSSRYIQYVRRSVNEAFHKTSEELKGEDYKIIQLVLKKKSDSEIADILGYKSKQAVQYKRTKIESKLREVMKPWFE